MGFFQRIRDRVSLALREAKFAYDQFRAGIPPEMITEDSVKRAFGKE
jgi:hypothetical protein